MNTVVILPTYNEIENIEKIIRSIFLSLPDIAILVVDDNSPDGTARVVKELQTDFNSLFLLLRSKKEGLGKAYIEAFEKILKEDIFDAVIMMDADFSHDPKDILRMLEFAKDNDVVIGSRYIQNGGTEKWDWWRKLLSRFGNIYAILLTGLPLKEITGGFNLIKTDFLRRIDWPQMNSSGYAFQIELKYYLYKLGALMKEIPIVFHERAGGESKISSHIVSEGIMTPWRLRKRQIKSRL